MQAQPMAQSSRRSGPVKIVKPATVAAAPEVGAVPIAEQKPAPRPFSLLAGMGPATLRERPSAGGKRSATARSAAIAWPEGISEAARQLEPRFSLSCRKLPHGRPAKLSVLSEPIPTESRKVLSAQIMLDAVNGVYCGSPLPATMAAGESLSLEWILAIMGQNPETYRKVGSWQTLGKLLTSIANLAGRFVLIDENGNLSLTAEDPDPDRESEESQDS